MFKLKKYDGREGEGTFRTATVEEILAYARTGRHVWFKSNSGDARRVKLNGAAKTWKTRPSDFRISIKYGMYEFDYITPANADRVLVEVPDGH